MKDIWIRRSAALLAGGVLGEYLPEQIRFLALGVLFSIGMRLIFWQPRDFFGKVFRPEIFLLAATILSGFLYGLLGERLLPEPLVLEQVELSGSLGDWHRLDDKAVGTLCIGEVLQGAESSDSSKGIPSDIGRELVGQSYRLTVYADNSGEIPGEWKRVQPGDYVRLQAHLERPKAPGTQGEFDWRCYYEVRGLSGTLWARGDVVILSAGEPSLPWLIHQQVRKRLETWDSKDTGVLEGIFFGDSSSIPEQIQERYKITGVLHVFAASGSNVAFVLGLSWMLFRLFPQKLRVGGTIMVLILYAVLCGGNAPIVRATILGIVVLLGRLGRGQVATLRWLFLAAAGLFIRNPLILRDLGFQLSFTAAWGILVLAPVILKLGIVERLPSLLRFPVAGTLAAQAATLPLLIDAFHRLSLIGFFVNVFILFILGSVLEIGLIAVALSFSGLLSVPLFQVSLWLLAGTNEILRVLAGFPRADVWVLNPGYLFWLLWYGGMGVVLAGKGRIFFIAKVKLINLSKVLKRHWSKIEGKGFPRISRQIHRAVQKLKVPISGGEKSGCLILSHQILGRLGSGLLIFLFLWSPWNSSRDLEVVMIDVGQGDSILIQTPRKQAILVDAGPRNERFDAGERVVLPYLLERGIGHLNGLLISHEDQDHIGGVRAVWANIPTDWLGVPDVEDRLDSEEWQKGLPLNITKDSEKLYKLQAGDKIELDSGVLLDILGPHRVLSGTHSDSNNNSLVVKLNYLGQSVLLTGDMEEEEMEEIAKRGISLENNLFKEPHHGSKFSLDKAVLDGMHPWAVCISVGKNTFGHPAAEVLEYWESRHVPVFRTDKQGTLTFKIGKRGMEVISGR